MKMQGIHDEWNENYFFLFFPEFNTIWHKSKAEILFYLSKVRDFNKYV